MKLSSWVRMGDVLASLAKKRTMKAATIASQVQVKSEDGSVIGQIVSDESAPSSDTVCRASETQFWELT